MVQPGVSALGKKNRTTVFPRKSFSETFWPFWSGKVNSGALSLISMRKFSSRSNLYRRAWALVIFAALIVMVWQNVLGQVSRSKISKGPRALGLLQLLPKGKARLIPVVILVDGQYYDASAYKASPVPMALWAETEYEALRTGISQGLFTVTGALQNPKTNEWIAEGTWQTAESVAAKSTRKPASSVPRGMEDDTGPPVLRHSGAAKPKPPEPAPAPAAPQAPAQGQPAASASTPSSVPAPTNSGAAPASTASASPTPAMIPEQGDQNRPTLKRGKPAAAPPEPEPVIPPAATAPKPSAHPAGSSASAKTASLQLIPAISDADGPEPHSYIYDLKPDEELTLRNKTLALAADQVRARVKRLSSELVGPTEPARGSKPRTTTRAKAAQPNFDNVQFRVFDLSSSNEPTMVLTASARMPEASGQNALADLQYFVTLVARQDINGDIHKAFSIVTDTQHLDVEPKFELIDAVDVDGDGRAELLFRKVYDASSAFIVYRVIGDQLYALFDGTPGE
jgi:hypothetical protein